MYVVSNKTLALHRHGSYNGQSPTGIGTFFRNEFGNFDGGHGSNVFIVYGNEFIAHLYLIGNDGGILDSVHYRCTVIGCVNDDPEFARRCVNDHDLFLVGGGHGGTPVRSRWITGFETGSECHARGRTSGGDITGRLSRVITQRATHGRNNRRVTTATVRFGVVVVDRGDTDGL